MIPTRSGVEAAPQGAALATLFPRSGAPLVVPTTFATIGADPANDIPLPDAGLAPRHGVLRLRSGIWTYASAAGASAQVDGAAVDGEAVLGPGSTLVLGDLTLAFDPHDRWEDSPAQDEPRVPAGMMPQASSRVWSTGLFLVALAVVIAGVVLLLRAH